MNDKNVGSNTLKVISLNQYVDHKDQDTREKLEKEATKIRNRVSKTLKLFKK